MGRPRIPPENAGRESRGHARSALRAATQKCLFRQKQREAVAPDPAAVAAWAERRKYVLPRSAAEFFERECL